jgi:hypothetical protein
MLCLVRKTLKIMIALFILLDEHPRKLSLVSNPPLAKKFRPRYPTALWATGPGSPLIRPILGRLKWRNGSNMQGHSPKGFMH